MSSESEAIKRIQELSKSHPKPNDKYKGKTVSRLKSMLWGDRNKPCFAEWVKQARSEDGIWCNCISCRKPIKIGTIDCQAGHFLPKKGYPFLYFHEDNVWPQCSYCNGPLQGNQIEFEKNLIHKIGKERVQWMHDHKNDPIKWNRADLIDKIELYKLKLKEL